MMTPQIITSRTNDKIKQAVKLNDRREREALRLFRFEGVKLLCEYLAAGMTASSIFVRDDVYDKYAHIAKESGGDVYIVPAQVYEKLTQESAPDGVLCIAPFCDNVRNGGYYGGGIVLEALRDSGNVGACLRSAMAFGIKNVYVSADCADIFSQKTVRSAMGAVFNINITTVSDVPELLKKHMAAGGRCCAAMPADGPLLLGNVALSYDDITVIGNEGHGISDDTAKLCTALTIPMDSRTESLNAAVAAAVIMWETARCEAAGKTGGG